jgi:serine/threonine protein kinase/tetratricopeptide (TPR) repeat protein
VIGKNISHYRVNQKLGQGGMGEVYLAEDTRLNRKVALKFLPLQYVSDQDLKTRFKREAQAAAALNHPNIITIHEVSEYEGRPYIAMEYVEGGSLKDLIRADGMSVAQVTNLALQISEGLAKAHQAEIVHRDIKPQNILIDADGRPRICDFGLAKLKREVVLTQTGTTLGTIAYMSPEQARGEEVDQRADIWSLGVVIYEMLTGQRPFRGDHDQALIYAILNNRPESISGIRPDAPDLLAHIIEKAMAKSPDDRYQDTAEIASELGSLKTELDSQLTKTVEAERRMSPSIAVLPFANLSADKEQEYFCDGMAEDIINALTNVEGLHVVARTSAFAFKGKSQDIRKIGKELSVSSVLEGSVRKAENRVRITAQLINVADGYHIWSEKFDRDLADVFAIQDEISLAIVEKLKVKLLGNEKQKMLKRYTQNLEAYDLYLKGRYHWNRRSAQSLKKAVAHFEQVIQKDPEYALAYSGLADSYSMLEQVQVIKAKEAFPKARKLAKKALEIDETLAEAHTSLAYVLWAYDWDWVGSEREFRRAIELNPNYATAHHWLAIALIGLMRTAEAIQEIQKALELDPLSLIINTAAGFVYISSGQEEKAIRQAEKILDMDPTFGFAYLIVVSVNERRKKYGEAAKALLKLDAFLGFFSQREVAALQEAYASSGWTGYLRKRLEVAENKAEGGKVPCYHIASTYAQLDEADKAIEWLRRAFEDRDKELTSLQTDDTFKKLQPDPRFREIIKKIGFPE